MSSATSWKFGESNANRPVAPQRNPTIVSSRVLSLTALRVGGFTFPSLVIPVRYYVLLIVAFVHLHVPLSFPSPSLPRFQSFRCLQATVDCLTNPRPVYILPALRESLAPFKVFLWLP